MKRRVLSILSVFLVLSLVSCDINITVKHPSSTSAVTVTDPVPSETTDDVTSALETTKGGSETTKNEPETSAITPEVTTKESEVTTKEPETTTQGAVETTSTPEETTSSEPHEHLYTKIEKVNEQFHVKICDCGHAETESHKFSEWTLIKSPTEFEEGENYRQCTVCGYSEKTPVPKLGHEHKFSDTWEFDGTSHFKRCECGETAFTAPHTFGEWKVTLEATETSEGTKERVCTVCGYSETAVIEKLSHVHSFSDDWKKDTTYHWHECSCGEIASKGMHTGSWVTTVEPTSSSAGERKYTCTVCGFTIYETIPALSFEGVSGTLTQNVHSNGYTRLVLKYETVSRSQNELVLKCTMYLNCYAIRVGHRNATLKLGDKTVSIWTDEVEKEYVKGQRVDLYLGEAEISMPLTAGKGSAQISFYYPIDATISETHIYSVTVEGTVTAN